MNNALVLWKVPLYKRTYLQTIYNIHVRTANREDPDQTASLEAV